MAAAKTTQLFLQTDTDNKHIRRSTCLAHGWQGLRNRPRFIPQKHYFLFVVLIYVASWVNPRAKCGRKDFENWKKYWFTSSDLEPTNFWFVAEQQLLEESIL
jgi:hypothetical protein